MTASDDPVLLGTDERGVATLTLARPDKGNAYNRRMLELLGTALARLSADPAVRIVVLRGAGKHFSVGGDILDDPELHSGGPSGPALMPSLCLALDACPKATIALVQGGCVGGAFALAACCDVLLAADDSFFAVPELRLGFPVGPYVPLFERALGARALRRLLITGERIDAAEARMLGVAHRVHVAAHADQALDEIVREILLSAPGALAAAKRDLITLAGVVPTADLLERLQADFRAGFEAPEGQEGRAAFREKRRPAWAT